MTPTLTTPRSVHFGDLSGSVWSRWAARIFRWGETLHPGAGFGTTDQVIVRVGPEVGPALAAACVGIPVNYALRDPDLLRCHYTPENTPFAPTYPEVFSGIVEECHADADGLVAVLAVSRFEAHDDLSFLDRAGRLGFAGLCLVHEPQAIQIGRTPWGATVVDVEQTAGLSVGFTAHPHVPGCRILRRLAPDEKLTAEDFAPPEARMVPASWRAGAPFHGAPISVASAAIATGKIAVNAVSQLLNTGIGGTVALSNVFQTLQSRVVTTAGGAVMVNAKAFTDFDSTAAARTITLRIRNTSTGLFSGTARWDVQAGLAHNGISHSLFFQEQPAAGTYTYVIEAALDATANITNPNGRSGYIQLAEMKR